MPFKWLQHDSKSTRLYYCGVTILGSAPPPTDTMMSVFLLPTLNGGKKKNRFHHQWFEKKLQPPNMQRVSLLFWEGVGDFVWGKNTSWNHRCVRFNERHSGDRTIVWRLCMETLQEGAAPGKQDTTSLQ